MKKSALVIAMLVAVFAALSRGGIRTASAFNPQPEPPGLPSPVETWFTQMFPVIEGDRGARVVSPIGADAPQLNPGSAHGGPSR